MAELAMFAVAVVLAMLVGGAAGAILTVRHIERPQYRKRWQAACRLIERLDAENRDLAVGIANTAERAKVSRDVDKVLDRLPQSLRMLRAGGRSARDLERIRKLMAASSRHPGRPPW